ncbi:MAG: EF-hand domain-containing protein [Cyclobacteriaceae bacterium]
MLTDFQKKKLTHYFDVLDFDSNGILEEADFLGVAENLCILRSLEEDARPFINLTKAYGYQWSDIYQAVGGDSGQVTLEQWLDHADKHIVNGTDEEFYSFISRLTGEIITNFDTDRDGFISMIEYVDLFVGYNIEVRYIAKSFRLIDRNGDAYISKEELVEAVEQFFSSDTPDDPGNRLFGFWSE